METLQSLISDTKEISALIPLGIWQIIAALFLTICVVQTIKLMIPYIRDIKHRKTTYRLISIVLGGVIIGNIYDQAYYNYVVISFAMSNNLVYIGISKFVEVRAKKSQSGIWIAILEMLKPHKNRKK